MTDSANSALSSNMASDRHAAFIPWATMYMGFSPNTQEERIRSCPFEKRVVLLLENIKKPLAARRDIIFQSIYPVK